ncbi:unnamed protein product [Didymodactylos carnosus]|uniref:NAD(P)(+)--arginine ADP-ribosyltransferase n=1 Tax=Didymodactylos carnosus TaxID=1234261 RepID=A0A815K4D3_9BILA|nr:unnamed protein product [Didymodactylos carnosus]CAF1384980.1 unnamed protein product [Didymodactylos carnosus]CAF3819139.1 unnamed protein product [Didymodactylos carnosus]CAF4280186.1 unnamed protein product [Didymodactylos carnosus]
MSLRYSDLEPISYSAPRDGYKHAVLVSLETATLSVTHLVNNLPDNVAAAKKYCKFSLIMTKDESAAIYLYTMEPSNSRSVYRILNQALRSRSDVNIVPWYPYLKLLCTALNKLPSVQKPTWRGVPGNISREYKEGIKFIWAGFSSCSAKVDVIKNFLNKYTDNTLFMIECYTGKAISEYSCFKSEDEIILMPGTSLVIVTDPLDQAGVHIVHLKEIQSQKLYPPKPKSAYSKFSWATPKQTSSYTSGSNHFHDLKTSDSSHFKTNTQFIKPKSAAPPKSLQNGKIALAEEAIQLSANATEATIEPLFPGATESRCVPLSSLGTPNRSEYDIMIE